MFEGLRRLTRQTASTLRAAQANFFWDAASRHTIVSELEAWAKQAPDDPFLWFEGTWLPIGEFDRQVNRIAHAWRSTGVRRGDVVAIMMGNRPEYLLHFYALCKLGVVAALINPALRAEALEHALVSAGACALIGDREANQQLRSHACELRRFSVDSNDSDPQFASFIRSSDHHSPGTSSSLRLGDVAAYIYTSGTTGLPKPAVVKHHRIWRGGLVFGGLVQTTKDDTIYCCLPLYHANAILIAAPSAIAHRARFALSRKFSASRFWQECRQSKATAFIYVGELVRYLANRPRSEDESRHQVTKILGNGLSKDLWPIVHERFGIGRIAEYYAATEGNAETLNLFNREASVGPLIPWKMAVVQFDVARGTIVRGRFGRAQKVRAGETGLLVGRISPRNDFAGYTDRRASEHKILRGLFHDDDAWFNSGDLVSFDRLLHLSFVDRIGDTFRWKAENVSTREVEQVLNRFDGIRGACVYGVAVQGHEGRAGMAAVVTVGDLDGAALFEHCASALPRYAMPRFIRAVSELETTGTFKLRKQDLQREGFEIPDADPLWLWDPNELRYRAVTPSSLSLAPGAFAQL